MFPCGDVNHDSYMVPEIDLDPGKISMAMISEAAPNNPKDYYYAKGDPLYQQTTVQAFKDAGTEASSITDLVNHGVYFTTAVKCGKKNYAVQSSTALCNGRPSHVTVRAGGSILRSALRIFRRRERVAV